MKNRYSVRIFGFITLIALLSASCKKLVEVPAPISSVNSANVYTTDATAIAALTGIYANWSNSDFRGDGFARSYGGLSPISIFPGLSADELTLLNGSTDLVFPAYYQNKLTSINPGSGDHIWNNLYGMINDANAAIAGLGSSNGLTPAVGKELLGEAYFIRAFCYFYLTNLYGDVPLLLTSDYKINVQSSRTSQKLVYQQIVDDLLQAQALLPQNYVDGTVLATATDRTRPNYWTATALLARVYLYLGDNANAYKQANLVIGNTSLFGLSSLTNTFIRASSGNKEAIWQLQSVGSGTNNTQEGLLFILPLSGPSSSHPFYLSNQLIQSFEPGDQRLTNWVGSVTVGTTTYYYPFKYKVNSPTAPATEYEMVFRLGEQYLIRAEAQANGAGNGTAGAVSDLNVIRTRAGLPNYSGATDAASMEAAILHERQVEMFTEWGHRWLDLKRTGTVSSVMGSPGNACAQKGGTWDPNWALYPIPLPEIQQDPNLTQNAGY